MNSQDNHGNHGIDSNEVITFWLRGPKTTDISGKTCRGEPITLVAYTYIGDSSVRFATATHCPPDQFSRKHAHNKAIGRLNSDQFYKSIDVLSEIGPEASIARHLIACHKETFGDLDPVTMPLSVIAACSTVEELIDRHNKRKQMKLNF